jgi:omega-6 fatty acid desaturase (delta-12 desaturase)
MDHSFESAKQGRDKTAARDWVKILAQYRAPKTTRSLFELAVTFVPFVALWALAWAMLSVSVVLSVGIALANGAFLLRLFAIQHDCGHNAFFADRRANDWLGRFLGVLTVTPYDVWKHAHAVHHGSCGNLDHRGIGDIDTLTITEYRTLSPAKRLLYRLYRNPLVLFGLGPGYMFLLKNRLPFGFFSNGRFWLSTMGTNVGLVGALVGIYAAGGWAPILAIFLPTTLMAATAGMWLFYVQHQFEHTVWDEDAEWDLHDSALHGSSHYILPPVLQWLSANIGIHHVHHLYSRIPFYRLPEVLRDHAGLADSNRLTIRESLATARLHLWDEQGQTLMSFAQARLQT